MGVGTSLLDQAEWSDPVKDGPWALSHGTLPDGQEISVFSCTKKQKKQENLLMKLTKQLRLVRHPNILLYVGSEDLEPGLQLYTEKAEPLSALLPELGAVEVSAGLYNVLEALSFLHDKVGSSHNNVHLGAVYVTSDGSWKLGGLEYMTRFSESTATSLSSSRPSRNQEALAPEEKVNKVLMDIDYGHSRDMYGFGILAESLMDRMAELGDLTKTFELRIQDECLNPDPRQRPKAKSLLQDRLFTTEFLEISTFLRNVTLKSSQERSTFFRELVPKLLKLPELLVAKRLLPSLLSRFVFMDQSAVDYVLPSLLTPCKDRNRLSKVSEGVVMPLFTEGAFKMFAVPKLVKIFTVPEYNIHLLMLKFLPSFLHLIEREDLELEILPQLLLGLRDTSDEIAALSLRVLADLVLIMGRDAVIGGQCKTFFKEGTPKEGEFPPPLMTTNNKSNLQEIMPKMKLMDLAKGPNAQRMSQTTVEADRKWKVREQRHEEMRRKREERKVAREREKAKAKSLKVQSAIENDEKKSLDEEEIQDVIYSNSVENEAEETTVMKSDWSGSENVSAVNIETENDWTKTENDSAEMENGDDHWSDFENDSDISDAIERELQSIDLNEKVEINTAHTDTNAVSMQSPKRQFVSTGNAMKLVPKGKIKAQNVDSKDLLKKETIHIDSTNSEENPVILFKHSKSTAPKSKVSKSSAASKPKSSHTLGGEFDIKSLDIKVSAKRADPFDFFADMAPSIDTNLSKKGDVFTESADAGSETVLPGSGQLSFGVQDSSVDMTEDGGGWGDDDW